MHMYQRFLWPRLIKIFEVFLFNKLSLFYCRIRSLKAYRASVFSISYFLYLYYTFLCSFYVIWSCFFYTVLFLDFIHPFRFRFLKGKVEGIRLTMASLLWVSTAMNSLTRAIVIFSLWIVSFLFVVFVGCPEWLPGRVFYLSTNKNGFLNELFMSYYFLAFN